MRRLFVISVILLAMAHAAEDPKPQAPAAKPTIEQLQKQVAEKDQRIANLMSQVAALQQQVEGATKYFGGLLQFQALQQQAEQQKAAK